MQCGLGKAARAEFCEPAVPCSFPRRLVSVDVPVDAVRVEFQQDAGIPALAERAVARIGEKQLAAGLIAANARIRHQHHRAFRRCLAEQRRGVVFQRSAVVLPDAFDGRESVRAIARRRGRRVRLRGGRWRDRLCRRWRYGLRLCGLVDDVASQQPIQLGEHVGICRLCIRRRRGWCRGRLRPGRDVRRHGWGARRGDVLGTGDGRAWGAAGESRDQALFQRVRGVDLASLRDVADHGLPGFLHAFRWRIGRESADQRRQQVPTPVPLRRGKSFASAARGERQRRSQRHRRIRRLVCLLRCRTSVQRLHAGLLCRVRCDECAVRRAVSEKAL